MGLKSKFMVYGGGGKRWYAEVYFWCKGMIGCTDSLAMLASLGLWLPTYANERERRPLTMQDI